jgi:hypothetical protein
LSYRAIGPILAVILAILATGAGCGDDESSADGTIETSSLSKEQFIKRANNICTKGTNKTPELLGEYIQEHSSPAKDEGELAAEAFREAIVPELESQIEEIESLGAPRGDTAQIQAYVDAQRASLADLEKRQTLSLVADLEKVFSQPGKLARRYGIPRCAYD